MAQRQGPPVPVPATPRRHGWVWLPPRGWQAQCRGEVLARSAPTPRGWQPRNGPNRYARVSADPARRQAGSGARICTPVGPELDSFGVLGGRAGKFRDRGTEPATGTGPRSAGLGCSGAGRGQCGVPAAPVLPHPSQPLHLARRPASPTALLQQPCGAVYCIGQGEPTSTL